jgi:hypothetical protein
MLVDTRGTGKLDMSYIRSLSNPEGLYIYSGEGGLEIVFPASNNRSSITCDELDFCRFVEKWRKNHDDKFSYKNFTIEERKSGNTFKWYLTIGGYKDIEMWYVTWIHIVNNVLKESDRPARPES